MITTEPIKIEKYLAVMPIAGAGAWNLFAGTVRNHHHGRKVAHLEYEAFQPLAENIIHEIVQDTSQKFQLLHTFCIHRIGKVNIGEIAVLIITSAAHRDAAYKGSRYIIDRVKNEAPVWKKEYWTDGSYAWGDPEAGAYNTLDI